MQKFDRFIISHWDADGVICVALAYKKFGDNFYTLFTSPFLLKSALTRIIMRNENLEELYIFDLSGNKVTLSLVSCFKKCIWIDHHVWNEKSFPKNVKVKVKKEKSCARVVADFFDIESKFVEIADQIDTNSIKSQLANLLRDYIAAIKWKYKGMSLTINNLLRQLARVIANDEFEFFINSSQNQRLIKSFQRNIEKIESELFDHITVEEINKMKVCFIELRKFIPAYRIFNFLKINLETNFDLVVIMYKKNGKTKIEFRTMKNLDVHKIASFLGGGGHVSASGASLKADIKIDELIETIKKIY